MCGEMVIYVVIVLEKVFVGEFFSIFVDDARNVPLTVEVKVL